MSKVSLATNKNSHHVNAIHGLNLEESEEPRINPVSRCRLPMNLKNDFQHENLLKADYSASFRISKIPEDLTEAVKMQLDDKSKIVFLLSVRWHSNQDGCCIGGSNIPAIHKTDRIRSTVFKISLEFRKFP